MPNNNQKGFTLVELSIVLVIIGLLIGGILAAQSMIATAKIQSLVRQFGQFDAAVVNFKDKFGGMPGDVAAVGTAAGAGTDGDGDGDGIVEDTAGAIAEFSGEIGTFWNALSLSGLSTDGQGSGGNTFVQTTAADTTDLIITGTTANSPRAKAGKAIATFIGFGASGANYYALVTTFNDGNTAWVATTSGNGAIKAVDALAVDTKMDDANPNAGYVMSGATSTTNPVDVTGELAGCSSGTAYTVSTTTDDCNLRVRIGSTVGNPM